MMSPRHIATRLVALAPACALAACVPGDNEASKGPVTRGDMAYLGVETRLLADDLVNFRVTMRGTVTRADVSAYAECAAAQYTLIRGFGFARHVRTGVEEQGKTWVGDAVYTISASLPAGARTLDAEVVTAQCAENGIPTV
ncbi:MAG: hypothetical protein ACWA47_04005 [Brevirhabdus sp.]